MCCRQFEVLLLTEHSNAGKKTLRLRRCRKAPAIWLPALLICNRAIRSFVRKPSIVYVLGEVNKLGKYAMNSAEAVTVLQLVAVVAASSTLKATTGSRGFLS
jgi:hypothetical protein